MTSTNHAAPCSMQCYPYRRIPRGGSEATALRSCRRCRYEPTSKPNKRLGWIKNTVYTRSLARDPFRGFGLSGESKSSALWRLATSSHGRERIIETADNVDSEHGSRCEASAEPGHETGARQPVRFIDWFIPRASGFGRQTRRMGLSIVGLGT